MKRLNVEQIKTIHAMLIIEIGGMVGVRDEELLELTVNAPYKTFDGDDIYRGLMAKAARLGYGIINNRPFIDGNERIGMFVMLVFLEINGLTLECGDADIVDIGLKLASGEMSQGELWQWISEHR